MEVFVCKECKNYCTSMALHCPIVCARGLDKKPNFRLADQSQLVSVPQPAPEPELMTAVKAIQACKGVGGEVWHNDENTHRVTIDAAGKVICGNLAGLSSTQPFYTVRPLPVPYPLDFAEAWEALGRGEKVEMEHEGKVHMISLNLVVSTRRDNYETSYFSIDSLNGKRFRIANERKET